MGGRGGDFLPEGLQQLPPAHLALPSSPLPLQIIPLQHPSAHREETRGGLGEHFGETLQKGLTHLGITDGYSCGSLQITAWFWPGWRALG